MADKYPYFPCYPQDFLIDPRFNRLPGAIRGTWCQLLLIMWGKGIMAELPDDDDSISFELNLAKDEWLEHRKELERVGLLTICDLKRLGSRRLSAEWGRTMAKCDANRVKANKRWMKTGEVDRKTSDLLSDDTD